MKISEWPENERPRERLLARGPQALSDSELLAVLIGCGKRGITAVDVARQLIKDFGSMSDFLRADKRRCLKQFGIGPAHYAVHAGRARACPPALWARGPFGLLRREPGRDALLRAHAATGQAL